MEMGLVQMELMLLQQSRNSLASQARRVNSVVRGRQQQRGNHSSNVTETRADGCSDTGSGTVGRAAAYLFFWMVQYTETSLHLQEPRSTATQLCVRTRPWADLSHSDDDTLRVSKR